jgi:polar amino acid transport system permease protein
VAKVIESNTFKSFEVFGSITLMYLVMSLMLMSAFGLISRRFLNYPSR